MSKSLKIFVASLLLVVTALGFLLTRQPVAPAWDGSALLGRAIQSLEGLPAKEADELRALLVSSGPKRVDDRTNAWHKTFLKEDLQPVAEFALANLRAWAERGDASAMWHLHFALTQRIATADEGDIWLRKAAALGHPRSVYDVTQQELRDNPAKLLKAMTEFVGREDDAGLQALYWFASAHEKGRQGVPKDEAKAADYRNRAKSLGEKLRAADTAK